MSGGRVSKVVVGGVVTTMLAACSIAPAGATASIGEAHLTCPYCGDATTVGGDGISTRVFTYSSFGRVGSGTLSFDFTVTPTATGSQTTGTGVLTRSDCATLTGTELGTVDHRGVAFELDVTAGTGGLAGVTGKVYVVSTTSTGLGVIGDVFGMLDATSPVTTSTSPVTTSTSGCACPFCGTATTVGGDGISTQDFTYFSFGLLGSGVLHFDFTVSPTATGSQTTGTGVLTRSDCATLTGTEFGKVDNHSLHPGVLFVLDVTAGTGGLAGVTGQVALFSPTYTGLGVMGDVFGMVETFATSPVTTSNSQCAPPGTTTITTARPTTALAVTGRTLARTGTTPVALYLGLVMLSTGACLVIVSRRRSWTRSARVNQRR